MRISRVDAKREKQPERGKKKVVLFLRAERGKSPNVQRRREHFQEDSCFAGSIFWEGI